MKTTWSALLLTLPSPALAQSADFDGATEGVVGSLYTENGLQFSDLDQSLGSTNDSFVIDDASLNLGAVPEFTSPNVLGFGTFFIGGPFAGYGRCEARAAVRLRGPCDWPAL